MKDYGMFSDAGNREVQAIVSVARMENLTHDEAFGLLYKLGEFERFAEATDTAVREEFGVELGFYH